jgi:Tol biopolymer transport system component
MKLISTLFLALSMLAAAAPAADTANDLFQQALVKERTEGNLPEAIKLYQRIVDKYATNHKVAAEALLQLAGCQSKLGDAQARKSLERLVRDFADQKETVAEASRRLAALGGGGPAGQPPTRLVWAGPKADGDSVSPDGRYLSYTDWDTGNLVLHDLVSDTDRVLTANGTMGPGPEAFAEGSAISRDGKQVAYEWWDDKTKRDESWVAELTGDPHPRRLYDGDSSPYDWSPDGKWLVVSFGDEHTVQIGLLAAQGGAPRAIKSWPVGSGKIGAASFSPDGKYIVYTRRMSDNDVRGYILSVDGKSETALAPESSDHRTPIWSPDGSRIVWVSGHPDSASRVLWSTRVADGKPVGEPEQLKADFGHSFLTGFARDGSLFYGASFPESDIYLADLDPATGKLTSQPKRVNEHGLGSSWGRIAWLPDGKSLSFWSRREGRGALVVHTLATGEERELWEQGTGSPGGYTGWFPDGSIMAAESTGQTVQFRRVESRTLETQATWTIHRGPAGTSVGYSRDLMTAFIAQKDEAVPCEGRICTYVMLARDLQTGRDSQICRFTAGAVGNLSRSVSPDGRDLAFTIQYQGHRLVMIAPTAGGPAREIYRSEDFRLRDALDWTKDGSRVLAFYDGGHGSGELWSFPLKGGSPEKSALHVGANATIDLNSAVSPDGTQFAFVGGGRRPEVWVMTGLFQGAKAASR